MKLKTSLRNLKLKYTRLKIERRKKPKVFCIGRNKTGTTTMAHALKELGYIVGDQRRAELLSESYWSKDFSSIIDYCKSAEAFQDVPFSYPETYKYVDEAFPNSKFILTVRDSPEQWYNSLLNFHSKLFGNGERPTAKSYQASNYVYKGWVWDNINKLYGFTEFDDPCEKDVLINHYIQHNLEARVYFKNRPESFIEINVSQADSYHKMCSFLGIESVSNSFPWKNKTKDIK